MWQSGNQFKWRHLAESFGIDACGSIKLPNLHLINVAKFAIIMITRVKDSIAWVLYAFGNVYFFQGPL